MDQATPTPAPQPKATGARANGAPRAASAAAALNSVEAAPEPGHLMIDGHAVASLAYSKRRAGEGLRFDVRAHDASGRTVAVLRDLDPDDLARTVGRVNAQTITASKGRGGTLGGEQLATSRDERGGGAPAAMSAAGDQAARAAEARRKRGELEAAQIARAARVQRVQALMTSLGERYLLKDNEYRFRGEPSRLAFVDRGGKLTTELATPAVARSMVDLAETKGWRSLRVRGDDGYRRQVWLEASLRDVKVVGFEPSRDERELLHRERQARQHNEVGRASVGAIPGNGGDSGRPGGRGSSRRQVLAVLRSALAEQKVDARTTDEVLRAAAARMDRYEAAGRPLPHVRVYDRQAPREAPVRVQAPRESHERQPRAR